MDMSAIGLLSKECFKKRYDSSHACRELQLRVLHRLKTHEAKNTETLS